MTNPSITRLGLLDMQVCVPSDWSDNQVIDFANTKNPAGTTGGWTIRTDETLLCGDPVRNDCDNENNMVHITLDC